MIRKAERYDIHRIAELACQLWHDNTMAEMETNMGSVLVQEDATFFLAFDGEKAIGFAQCQLRHDYVEGTQFSPVGYLEGIYVAEDYRKQGIARELLSECEKWAKEKGCLEFASDCELDNVQSLQFHLKMGFAEANRIICFTKKL